MRSPSDASTPAGRHLTLRSVRRGVVDLQFNKDSPLLEADHLHALRQLLCCVFAVQGVRRVRLNRKGRRVRIEYPFGQQKSPFLKSLSTAIRSGETDGNEVSEAALEAEVVDLERKGNTISSWKIRDLPGHRIKCSHPLLQSSLAVAFSLDQALELVDGLESIRVDRITGSLTLTVDPDVFDVDVLIVALESAIAADRPLAGFLPPTPAGYALDAALIATSAISVLVPFPTVIASAGLLCSAYSRQLRDAALAAREWKCDWNTVIAAVVGLTILNGTYLPAALMSLALRSWKSLEHESVAGALARLREAGLPAVRAEWIARAALAHDASGQRAARLANNTALPTLGAAAVGMVLGGPPAALGAVRPDYLSSPRFGNRMEALKALALLSIHGVTPSGLDVCESVSAARIITIHPDHAADGNWSDMPGAVVLPSAPADQLRALHERTTAESVIYLGPELGWDHDLRQKLIWCVPTTEACPHESADVALFDNVEEGLLALLSESRAYLRHRRILEGVPTTANSVLTGLGALSFLPSWSIAIWTNLLTAAAWLGTRKRSHPLAHHHKLSKDTPHA